MNGPRLVRSLPADLRVEWAAEIARPPVVEASREGRLRLLVARVGGDWLGFPPDLIASTLPVGSIRRIPHRVSGNIEGLFNADGRVVVCVNLERLLQTSAALSEDASAARMLILQWRHTQVAVRVSSAWGLEEIDLSALQKLREGASASLAGVSRGVAIHINQPVVCLDAERLVASLQEAIE
ncbi:chemotaxis signal transduction protein [Terrimicrobium sacchariphilum]|uniref:Chemotaxis signal transduction protein n=1 Tax=Terrimicrobium sacchariphilum TaxID=690879 RepID=A0A146GCH6_TERSA|nr:chemotaxis protein CheW [Terrimicrobium sacchariphilum]GAT35050.1 chemotaxis signal transduction protein [Terrimicrobium sacchariphilum]